MKSKPKILIIAGKFLFISGLFGLFVTITGYFALKALKQPVIMIVPHDSLIVETNRSLYVQGDNIVEIYGNSLGEKIDVVVFDKKTLIRPIEDTTIVLYPVNKQIGENPLQWKTVTLFFWPFLITFIVDSIIGFYFIKLGKKTS